MFLNLITRQPKMTDNFQFFPMNFLFFFSDENDLLIFLNTYTFFRFLCNLGILFFID